MSLVHEALEKAAREKQRKTGPLPASGSGLTAATPPTSSGSGLPTATPRRSRGVWWIAGVALVAVLVALWFAVKAYRHVEQALTAPAPPPPSTPVKVIDPPVGAKMPLPPPPSAPLPVTESRFKVSGIMRDPDGTFVAVINGKVVSETHYVDGATVKKIERDRVTLEVDGKETVLRLF